MWTFSVELHYTTKITYCKTEPLLEAEKQWRWTTP